MLCESKSWHIFFLYIKMLERFIKIQLTLISKYSFKFNSQFPNKMIFAVCNKFPAN